MAILTIHATNVTGLGACQVVVSLLEAIENLDTQYERIDCYVPESGPVSDYIAKTEKLRVIHFKRRGSKALSRVMECVLPELFFDIGEHVIVLGDVPLRTRKKQLVLVHQPHLQYPKVNRWVSRKLIYRVMRALTKFNASYADCVIAQTDAIASGLRSSYSDWLYRDCIKVIAQPPPSWFTLTRNSSTVQNGSSGLRLFYPAAEYPHKNHSIFEGLPAADTLDLIESLTLTIGAEGFTDAPEWLTCVGRLNQAECLLAYKKADALIFPSVLESYGLPLVEAMVMGLPIIAADLPYARVLCGDEGIYFSPESSESLLEACRELKARLADGWRPDWSSSLDAMPKTWGAVAEAFLQNLK